MKRMKLISLAAILVLSTGLAAMSANAATIIIENNDGPGEGFNDPTPAAPVGGNLGATLGTQRLIAFAHAACAATIRGRRGSQPSRSSSTNPRWVAMKVSPTAAGATTTSGACQPDCSAIS